MNPDQLRDASLLELFALEAQSQAEVLNAGLLALERDPAAAEQLEACMRAAHSLKGAARIVGLDGGVRVAHVMEDCLVAAQRGALLLRPVHIDTLLHGTDLLLRLGCPPGGDLDWADQAGKAEVDALVHRMGALLAGEEVDSDTWPPGHAPAAATPANASGSAATEAIRPAPPGSPVAEPIPANAAHGADAATAPATFAPGEAPARRKPRSACCASAPIRSTSCWRCRARRWWRRTGSSPSATPCSKPGAYKCARCRHSTHCR